MNLDLSALMEGWPYEPGKVTARRILGDDGREKIQCRLECGVLQMECEGRPDGRRPQGFPDVLGRLRSERDHARRGGAGYELTEDDWQEIDGELMQFYHRRICRMALSDHGGAVADADHNLALMDLMAECSDETERIAAHEQYRPFILMHRSQAAANVRLDRDDPEGAVDDLKDGCRKIREYLERSGGKPNDSEPHLAALEQIDRELRTRYKIGRTLREQLEAAVALQDYETAARLRDRLKARR
jgi:hypothetical protein